jgi:hypothetical protein
LPHGEFRPHVIRPSSASSGWAATTSASYGILPAAAQAASVNTPICSTPEAASMMR